MDTAMTAWLIAEGPDDGRGPGAEPSLAPSCAAKGALPPRGQVPTVGRDHLTVRTFLGMRIDISHLRLRV